MLSFDEINRLRDMPIGLWPLKFKVLAMVLIAVVFGLVFYMFCARALLLKRAGLLEEENVLKQRYVDVYQHVAHYPFYQKEMKQLTVMLEQLVRQLPTRSEVPGLLDDISQAAFRNGLDFKVIRKAAEEEQHSFYKALKYDLTLTGTYHQFGQFVSDVAALPRLVTLHDYRITRTDRDVLMSPLQLQIVARTYYHEML